MHVTLEKILGIAFQNLVGIIHRNNMPRYLESVFKVCCLRVGLVDSSLDRVNGAMLITLNRSFGLKYV